MNLEIEMYLKDLGLRWMEIVEAMSDENRAKTLEILKKNPKITKAEFLQAMGIEEE